MDLADSYVYDVKLEWTDGRSAQASADGLPMLELSAPPEFGGQPGRWTPENLLVAATASCFLMTFVVIAERNKLAVDFLRMSAVGRLEKVPGEGYRFTEITLTPEIYVADDDVPKAIKLVEKAKTNCFVSNSLRTPVQVEPRIVVAATELAR